LEKDSKLKSDIEMKIASIILFLFPLFLFSQEIENPNNKGSIAVLFGIDYCHYFRNHEEIKTYTGLLKLNQFSNTKGALGWRIGMNFNARISQDYLLNFGSNFNVHQLKISSDFDYEGDSSIKFIFIEFPVILRREMEDRKLSPYLEFGIAPVVFLSLEEDFEYGYSSLDSFKDQMNPVDFAVILAGGFNYNFNKNKEVYFQPTYRYHIIGIESFKDSKDHFYNFGLEVGFRSLF